MTQKPASKETIQRLYENMGTALSSNMSLLCSQVSSLECLEQLDENGCNNIKSLRLNIVLLRISVFSLLMNSDLSTFFRANFRTTSAPEKRFNLKHVNVITLEGYKYLFGFGKDKDNAIWSKLKKIAEQIDDAELTKDINDIEQHAKEFENSYALSADTNTRNLSIHYDIDPLMFYAFLEQIGEDNEVNRASAFFKIIETLLTFFNKYISRFQIPLICSTNNYDIDAWEKINYFPNENNKLFSELGMQITSYCDMLDNIVTDCKKVKILQEKNEIFAKNLQPVIKSIYPFLHVQLIYLDLASAIRAYLSSEYYFEKQLNLRRINVIVYEGFKHIYGYTDTEQSKSFWKQHISSILISSMDIGLTDTLTKKEKELKDLALDKDINNMQLRECSVHYRFKDKDNILPLFHALININPIIEMNKALKLLRILPDLIKLNTNSLGVLNINESEKIKLSNANIIGKFDSIIDMIEYSNFEIEKKQEMIANFNEIKNTIIALLEFKIVECKS